MLLQRLLVSNAVSGERLSISCDVGKYSFVQSQEVVHSNHSTYP